MESLSFLIPAYNDEATIVLQVNEAEEIGQKLAIPFEIVVINDASRDDTGKKLLALKTKMKNLRIITHAENDGYGSTIKELYCAAKYEWLFTIPGDYQVEAKEIHKLIPYTQNTDMILGWRVERHDTGARQQQSLIYNKLIPFLFGISTHDVNTVRLMKTNIMKHVTLHGVSAFTDAELIIKTQRAGYTIREIPINHKNRLHGTGSGGGKLKVILPTIREMLLLYFGLL